MDNNVAIMCNADSCSRNNQQGECLCNYVNLDVQVEVPGMGVEMICQSYEPVEDLEN
jgi:hypothetical protein